MPEEQVQGRHGFENNMKTAEGQYCELEFYGNQDDIWT